ncbi:MAG: hypothetical protein GY822_10240 [Deltaproteobacteria bacterium]|nr:hypothetical protein [Deltaproteobacteria bacterium]
MCRVSGLPRASSSVLKKAVVDADSLPKVEIGIWWRLLAAPFGDHGDVLQVAFVDPEVAKEASLLGLPEHAAYLGSEKDIKAMLERTFGAEPENSVIVTGLLPQPNLGDFDRDAKTQRAPIADEETVERTTGVKDTHTKIEDVFEVGTQDFELLPSSESAVKIGVVFSPRRTVFGRSRSTSRRCGNGARLHRSQRKAEDVTRRRRHEKKSSREEVVTRRSRHEKKSSLTYMQKATLTSWSAKQLRSLTGPTYAS